MAERWQRWMPFHIDKWRGSPDVRAMHPAARMGYLELLCSCWQSSTCSVSDDPIDLATNSGLGDELWFVYGPRILRKFILVDGKLLNEVLFKEWSEALRVYEKRKSGAVRTNFSRSASAEHTHTERLADTHTHTSTHTYTKEQKPSRQKAPSDPRFTSCVEVCKQYANFLNVPFRFGAADGKQLKSLLSESGTFTPDDLKRCLWNRSRSDGSTNGDRPAVYLPSITRYSEGPLDQYGKRKHVKRSATEEAAESAKAQSIADNGSANRIGDSSASYSGSLNISDLLKRAGRVPGGRPNDSHNGTVLQGSSTRPPELPYATYPHRGDTEGR